MTITQSRKILTRIAQLEEEIEVLKKARMEAAASGFASATISTSGGSKSYSRMTPEQFTSVINELLKELIQWRNLLTTGNANPLKTIITVYS